MTDISEIEGERKFCTTRKSYRSGKKETAVKVYTIHQESKYILVKNIPSLGVIEDIIKLFSLYGVIEEYRVLDDHPASTKYLDVILIKFKNLQDAIKAKKKNDSYYFMGKVIVVEYDSNFERPNETLHKLNQRYHFILSHSYTSSFTSNVDSTPLNQSVFLPHNTTTTTSKAPKSSLLGDFGVDYNYPYYHHHHHYYQIQQQQQQQQQQPLQQQQQQQQQQPLQQQQQQQQQQPPPLQQQPLQQQPLQQQPLQQQPLQQQPLQQQQQQQQPLQQQQLYNNYQHSSFFSGEYQYHPSYSNKFNQLHFNPSFQHSYQYYQHPQQRQPLQQQQPPPPHQQQPPPHQQQQPPPHQQQQPPPHQQQQPPPPHQQQQFKRLSSSSSPPSS